MAGLVASAAASALATPSLAQSARARTLVFAPIGGLLLLDPSFTPITPTTNHGYYIFDTLYSTDSKYRPRPQMVEGHVISDENLTWNITLRPGLRFHDGEPVLARDCVASIRRWGQRDAFGSTLLAYSNEISAADDTTIRFRLRKPFPLLPDALAHPTSSPCFMMPERLASIDIGKPITEMVGSGPFKFAADEFVANQKSVYKKNLAYVPRQENPDGMSGGKVVYFDRAEWTTIPDFATASAALQAGEIDWWESVQFDLIDLLKRDKGVTVATSDPSYIGFLRFNCGTQPFNNPALRRAVAAGIDQSMFMQALVGPDPSRYHTCFAMYSCGMPGVEELGKGIMDGKKDYDALAEQIKKAGYNGEKVVLLGTADVFTVSPLVPVLQDVLTKMGMNVELQMVDLSTLVTRRTSQAPTDKGGWNLFLSQNFTPNMANPAVYVVGRGLGVKGFAGNYSDPELEADVTEWIDAATQQERDAKLNKTHQRLWDQMPLVPLGSYAMQTAFRANLTGYVPNTSPVPWNIRRVDSD